MSKIVKLYWFKDKPNVGDAVSSLIVGKLSGKPVCYRNINYSFIQAAKHFLKHCFIRPYEKWVYLFPFQKCLMAVGSILDYADNRCLIWGTGFREYKSVYTGGKSYAVRGYLSRSKLPLKYHNIPVGDPAILLPLIIDRQRKRNEIPQLAIIPHYYDFQDINSHYSDRYKILDVRTSDVEGFIKELLNYDYVLSSSLHGLIISHSYGIPAIWFYKNSINSGSFKFHDYFSSVNIPLYEGFTNIETILHDNYSWKLFFEENKQISLPQTDIFPIQRNLLNSFPYQTNLNL